MPFRPLDFLSGAPKQRDNSSNAGKTDLLLRFFDSQFFDEWIAITYLYKSNSQGVVDYLCNRLYGLPEQGIERYLSQLAQLVVQRQSPSLDKALVDLCARSLRIAVKTYWLLLAIAQDQPKNKYVENLKDRCEQAALEGYWEPPFRDTRLLPMSPNNSFIARHGPLSPTVVSPPTSPTPGSSHPHQYRGEEGHSGFSVMSLERSFGGGSVPNLAELRSSVPGGAGMGPLVPGLSPGFSPLAGPPGELRSLRDRYSSPEPERPLSPDGLGRTIYSCNAVGQRIDQMYLNAPLSPGGSTVGSPRGSEAAGRAFSPPPVQREWHSKLQLDIPEDYAAHDFSGLMSPTNPLSPPSSPRLRHATFGATLDFVEALCTASSNLTEFTPEYRQWALCRALEALNAEIDKTARNGVAIWFPMGRKTDRVVRLVSNEVAILNSREKAPFLLYIEVLNADDEGGEAAEEAAPDGDQDLLPTSLGNHVEAAAAAEAMLPDAPGPSPTEVAANAANGDPAAARVLDFDVAAAAAVQEQQLMAEASSSGAAGGSGGWRRGAGDSAGPSGRPPITPKGHGRSLTGGGGSHRLMAQPVEDSFTLGLKSALAGLRGEGPLVQVSLEVLPEPDTSPSAARSARRNSSAGASPAGTPSARGGDEGGSSESDRAMAEGGRALGLLSRWGFYRSKDFDAEQPGTPGGSGRADDRKLVRLRLQVVGGVDLRIRNSPAKHRRVPSHEALLLMAAQHKTCIGQPAAPSGPAPAGGEMMAAAAAATEGPPPVSAAAAAAAERAAMAAAAGASHPGGTVFQRRSESADGSGIVSAADAAAAEAAARARTPPASGSGASSQATQGSAATSTPQGSMGSTPGAAAAGRPPGQRSPGPKLDLGCVLESQHRIADVVVQLDVSQAAAAHATMTERQLKNEQLMKRKEAAASVYGERFAHRKERLRKQSPHGRRPGWDLRPLIVKTGDDCRQELLALQLVHTFKDIFTDASLPLWLCPFEVLVTSNRTALIEVIPDCLSIHTVKARSGCTSLRQFFCDKFVFGSPEFHKAQRNFVESMAAYCIVTYLLQMKDRHNGNLMLTDQGHLVHIDFGFMLSNSPGGVNFESAPFKLTRELLEVMDSNSEGAASELFDYFKVLMIQGFLVCRKHADRILLLVEMMQHSGCPCFKAGARALQALRRRFHLNLTDTQCVEMVLGLIADSLDAWRTRQYDYYQRVLNGIL